MCFYKKDMSLTYFINKLGYSIWIAPLLKIKNWLFAASYAIKIWPWLPFKASYMPLSVVPCVELYHLNVYV